MFRATLRSLLAYKLRLALSGLAIVLGVAFVVGTFVFTDSLKAAFNDLTKAGQADVVISPATAFDTRFTGDVKPLTLPDTLVTQVAAVPGAEEAQGVVRVRNVSVVGPDGAPIGGDTGPGSSGIGESWTTSPALQEWKLEEGAAPVGAEQVVIDRSTATEVQVTIGQQIPVVLPDGQRLTPTVSGIVAPTLTAAGNGATAVIWDLPTAETLLTSPGQVTQIRVDAKEGTSQEQLLNAITPVLPADAQAQTGDQISSDLSKELDDRLGFINTFLLVFGLIALFVSAFLIYNTFSILVAQRTRELALLRAIGATRAQVMRAVLLEALVVALIATTVGLVVGAGVALGLQAIFAAAGAPLPGGGLVFLPRTLLVAYGIGLAVTLISALIPARRASSIAPVAAMRHEGTPAPKALLRRGIVGAVLIVVAVALAFAAFSIKDSSTRASMFLGLSALAAILGALALAPLAAVVLVPILGAPFRGPIGLLARENARRNPRRTAATAGALMIGLTLISAMSVLASSTIKSTDAVVDDVIGSDFVVLGKNFAPMPPAVAQAVAAVPGVGVSTAVRSAVVKVPGGDSGGTFMQIVDPTKIADVLKLTTVDGSLADLSQPGTVIVDTKTAGEQNLTVGSPVTLTTITGDVPVTVVGLYEPAGFFAGFASGYSSATLLGAPDQDSAIYVKTAPGADAATVRAGLDEAIAAYPTATLQDQSEFKAQIRDQINQLLIFIIALLILAVLIAFLGIVNTLALSVFERTREIGLLRAVGTTRAQVRRMILIESVLIAILGSVLGLVIGVLYGIGLQRVLANDGISELGINWTQLVLFLVVSAVGGVVAALWPAFRASRLNVLQAIATE